MDGGTVRFVSFAMTTAWAWCADERGLHGEGIICLKGLIGIQFVDPSLKVGVKIFGTLLEFTHVERGGLEHVFEDIRLHREMDCGVRCEG